MKILQLAVRNSCEIWQQKWQPCYLASRMSFPDTFTLYRKTAVLLKLSKVNFPGSSFQPPKFNIDKST